MATHTSSKAAHAKAQAKYDAKNRCYYNNIYIKCHKEHDKELLAWLATKDNKTAYIKGLIKADMASGK
jgi:hypothetical protein